MLNEFFMTGSVSVNRNRVRLLLFSIVTSLLAEDIVQFSVFSIKHEPDKAEVISLQLWQEEIVRDLLKLNTFIVLFCRLRKIRLVFEMEPGSKVLTIFVWFSIK